MRCLDLGVVLITLATATAARGDSRTLRFSAGKPARFNLYLREVATPATSERGAQPSSPVHELYRDPTKGLAAKPAKQQLAPVEQAAGAGQPGRDPTLWELKRAAAKRIMARVRYEGGGNYLFTSPYKPKLKIWIKPSSVKDCRGKGCLGEAQFQLTGEPGRIYGTAVLYHDEASGKIKASFPKYDGRGWARGDLTRRLTDGTLLTMSTSSDPRLLAKIKEVMPAVDKLLLKAAAREPGGGHKEIALAGGVGAPRQHSKRPNVVKLQPLAGNKHQPPKSWGVNGPKFALYRIEGPSANAILESAERDQINELLRGAVAKYQQETGQRD